MKKEPKRFLFTLTPEADKLLEKLYLSLKRQKPKSVLLNEMIIEHCKKPKGGAA